MGMKAPSDVTVDVWNSERRGTRAPGAPNEGFLNASVFRDFASYLEPYKARVGPVIFEFGTFNKTSMPTPGHFYERLAPFLADLPVGYRYAIEVRNPEYLSREYFDLLRARGVAHCFNAWTLMPGLDEQAGTEDAYTAEFTVVRALLRKWRGYDVAVKAFAPYDRIQEVDEVAREGMVRIAGWASRMKPAFLFVNNRLEGNTPSTIEAVIDCMSYYFYCLAGLNWRNGFCIIPFHDGVTRFRDRSWNGVTSFDWKRCLPRPKSRPS